MGGRGFAGCTHTQPNHVSAPVGSVPVVALPRSSLPACPFPPSPSQPCPHFLNQS